MRNATEIRLIDSNGQNDRPLWSHPDAKPSLGLFDLAWRPDGKELAFSSSHEAISSLYHADIYAICPDGLELRKITNAPDHKDFGKFKKGSITLTVRNNQYSFQQAQSSAGVFFVNIIGADSPQQVTIPPGSSKILVFKSVADFGDRAQALVQPEGDLSYHPMFGGKNPMGTCEWDWGPTPETADKVIYSENSGDEGSGIYLMKERGIHDPSTKLTFFSDIQYQILNDLQWLPDGSGFLYSTVNLFRNASNIFWYDTKTK